LEETVGWIGTRSEVEYENGGGMLDERESAGDDCGCVSAGLLDGFSSAVATFTTLVGFAGGLVAPDSVGGPVGVVLSTFALPCCKTGFGGLAETKCLPPPGFEEKKEE